MINWKLRIKNKATLIALIASAVAFFYQIAGVAGIVVPVSQDNMLQIIGIIINALCTVGIVVDPTTEGVSDSDRAMGYKRPRGDE